MRDYPLFKVHVDRAKALGLVKTVVRAFPAGHAGRAGMPRDTAMIITDAGLAIIALEAIMNGAGTTIKPVKLVG